MNVRQRGQEMPIFGPKKLRIALPIVLLFQTHGLKQLTMNATDEIRGLTSPDERYAYVLRRYDNAMLTIGMPATRFLPSRQTSGFKRKRNRLWGSWLRLRAASLNFRPFKSLEPVLKMGSLRI